MRIVDLDQRSDKWHAWRKEGLGSSDASVLMGCNPYKTPLDLYNEKHSIDCEVVNNDAMKRGTDYEKEALTWSCSVLGVELVPLCVEHEGKHWMRASLDGYSKEQNFLIEIKIPLERNFEKQCLETQDMHYCQIQWHLMVSGLKNAYLCVYSPEMKTGVMKFIPADHEYQVELQNIAEDFWFNHVIAMEPPKKPEMRQISDLKALELAKELQTYIELRKKFEALENDLKQSLSDYQDGSSYVIGNLIFRSCSGTKRLDRKLMEQDGIDCSKYEVEGKPFYKVEIKK